ncbi:MAG: UDP-N-acetylmuramoyl-L-alanine--D-glutamate ligase [Clostridia bacterium]|nr:UDP-N-acetylmuramoyl-L-alanine--D-glutamate ligase [Clostridia bacterium]
MENFQGKKVLIMGLARSGLAAARLLTKLGAEVTVSESRPIGQIKEKDELTASNVRLCPQTPEVFEEPFDLAVKNPGINGSLWFVKRLRERGIPVITEIELAFSVTAPQHYVAVTGTNGKTTTATLLYEILKAAYPDKTHVTGNIGTALCETVLENDLLNEGGHYIVLEISNFQLVDIVKFRPEIAVILNLAPDHLDFMGSEDAYYRSKCRVYENMTEDDTFLLNADDALLAEYTEKLPVRAKTVTFSTVKPADIRADDRFVYANGKPLFELSALKIVGRHNVQNVLAAVGAALALGVDETVLARAVADFKGVEHRIEFVREKDGVKYYNDSKGTNVDATVTALRAFSSPVILLAGGHEKGLSFEPLKPLLSGVKEVIGYGECGKRLIDELTDGKGTLCKDLPEALERANAVAEPGDVVLLSPTTSSYDQYTCFEERGEHFKTLVNAL